MSSNLHQAGVKLLRLLGRHAELVMDTYLGGSIDEEKLEPAAVKKLTESGILWRPEPGEQLRLSRNVRALLEDGLKDERNRQINANVGSALATIKTLASHYREARASVDYSAAEAYLGDLSEQVYSFTESLRYSIRVLWGRINNEFGYVGSISAKIRENELAQSQVTELLNGLEMFEFSELGELAGDIRELRRLLVTSLQETLSSCAQELSVVQGRLLELLGRFRKIQGRTRLLKGWLLYTDLHPDYEVADHVAHKQIPQLFNQAQSLLAPAAVDVHNPQHEPQLLELVASVKAISRESSSTHTLQQAQPVAVVAAEAFDIPDNPLKQAVEEYFCAVIDSGRNQSALQYLESQQLPWDAESWLFQVIGGFEGLSDEHKQFFDLEPLGEAHPIYSGNFIIRDVEVGLR
ncbi:phosphoenolpyruvate carboxylase [Shewanella dokdonensis]|uniref:Phosphoenolpyruvate carboxylase n=1 Tax=Shewanella dokdonensis TaxID=712036 RepID=A0ABX8DC62_9GAMM|nr:phosphoenolpyruvate carboxylase [Shewanella dokdonensis]MCL1074676.1 phosphoenolpyruvate carboxylase [Shewanella dokdonensis]QVK22338.1 phosphoenolpyruvate carboxylase [Shewanella dokdonensis]